MKKVVFSIASIVTLGLVGVAPAASAVSPCDTPTLINGSFEDYTRDTAPYASHWGASEIGTWMNDWGTPKQFLFLDLDEAPQALVGWRTTNSDNLVELQRQVAGYVQDGTKTDGGYFDGFAVQPARGNVWAELNATEDAALYQDVALTSGVEYTWSIKHHGRVFGFDATDEMAVYIGQVGDEPNLQTSIRRYDPINDDLFVGAPVYDDSYTSVSQIRGDIEDGWVMYRGTFTPGVSGNYRFQFESVDGWALEVGNLIDDVEFAPTECVSDPAALPDGNSESLAPTGALPADALWTAGLVMLGVATVLRRRWSRG